MSLSSTKMAPSLGRSKPAIILSSVVLPQPDGPSSVTNSPFLNDRSTSRTTVLLPKRLLIS